MYQTTSYIVINLKNIENCYVNRRVYADDPQREYNVCRYFKLYYIHTIKYSLSVYCNLNIPYNIICSRSSKEQMYGYLSVHL